MNYRSKYTGAEIEAALDKIINNVTDNDELATIIGNVNKRFVDYLPLTGGVIIGDLTYNSNTQSGTYIRFRNANGIIGYLGVSAAKNGIFSPDGSAYYTLLHEGNYSDLITGTLGVDITGYSVGLKNPNGNLGASVNTNGNVNFNYDVLGATWKDTTKNSWRITLGDTSVWLQASKADGSNAGGEINIGGYNGVQLAIFKTYADKAIFSNAVKSNAVEIDTGGLRVQGNLNVPIEINGSNIKRYGRNGDYLLSDNYYGLTSTKLLVQVGVFANDDELNFYCIGNRIESSAEGERWFTINSASSTFFVPTSFASGITVPSGQSITFVDANGNNHVLSWDDTAGGLKVDNKIITLS